MKLFQTREVLNRVTVDGRPTHARCPFPDVPKGTLVWTPVLEIQLAGARPGDVLIVCAGCTVSTKQFFKHDKAGKKTKEYGSAIIRCEVVLSPLAQPKPWQIIDRPVGLMVGLGSGTNSTQKDNLTPYRQPGRSDIAVIPWEAPWLTVLVAPASNDAQKGDYVEAYATSQEYAHLSALVFDGPLKP